MKLSQNTQKAATIINKAELLYCGYCTNNEKRMFRRHKNAQRVFPAAVLLLHHRDKGYILCDTGYSPEIYKLRGIIPRLYEILNPTTVCNEDTVQYQLTSRGIDPSRISTVILTHLHPDHIGGLKAFNNSQIILSERAYSQYRKNSLRSLIFKQLLPADLSERAVRISFSHTSSLFSSLPAFDIFGDGSVIALLTEGHAKGQMGIYLPEHNILFAADACWKNQYKEKADKMRLFPAFIQHSFKQYKKTLQAVNRIEKQGTRVIFSHDDVLEKGGLI